LNISDEQVETTPTSLQTGEGSSHALGGGRHHFPHAQKVYMRKSKMLAKPMMMNEIQEPETTEVHTNPIQPKEPITKVVPPSSSSFEDDVDRYKTLIRKRSTRPQNKFILKSKAMYNPAIKDKVVVIDEEPINPNVEPSTSKKVFKTRVEKKKHKKEDLAANKKVLTEKDRVSARQQRKQSKQSKKGTKPLTRSEDGKPKKMTTRSETKQTRGNNLDMLDEAAKSLFQGEVSI
jgi:hypothetical protein